MTTSQSVDTKIVSHLLNTVANTQILGVAWPDSAEFCVMRKVSTWPCGWEKEATVYFFENRAEFDEHIATLKDWALCDDNFYALKAFSWDWGPVHMPMFDMRTFELPNENDVVANVHAPQIPTHRPIPPSVFRGAPDDDERFPYF